jgi:hypothetical protein
MARARRRAAAAAGKGDSVTAAAAEEEAVLELELDEDGRVAGAYTAALDFGARAVSGLLRAPATIEALARDAQALREEERRAEQTELQKQVEDQQRPRGARRPRKEQLEQEQHQEQRQEQQGQGSGVDGTFWLPARARDRPAPPCLLEQVAGELFDHYTAQMPFDEARSGAEWWVQVRELEEHEPEPGAGRAGPDVADPQQKQQPRRRRARGREAEAARACETDGESIGMHFDKDEALCALSGLFVAPALSTVTYLSSCGAPTVLIPRVFDNASGAIVVPSRRGGLPAGVGALLSYPFPGNHLVFDGRLLHGCPKELRPARAAPSGARRVTLLLNVWLDHAPLGLGPLPRHVAAKLTPAPSARVALDWTTAARCARLVKPAAPPCRIARLAVREAGAEARFALPCPDDPTLGNLSSRACLLAVDEADFGWC